MKRKRVAFVMLAVLLVSAMTTVFGACGGSGDKELDNAIKSGKLILNVRVRSFVLNNQVRRQNGRVYQYRRQ